MDGQQKIEYTYDTLARLQSKKLAGNYVVEYAYVPGQANGTTTLLASVTNGSNTPIQYGYDASGNIQTISEGGILKAAYAYDELNQLIREDNAYLGKTILYTYDAGGNILEKSEYAYTTGEVGSPLNSIHYSYEDSNWKDKLTTYDGQAITYDAIGNPLDYREGMHFTWQNGRQLASVSKAGTEIAYLYDDSGIRTRKTVNGAVTDYYLNGDRIAAEITGADRMDFFYDETGNVFGFNLNGADYTYIRNGQNDIIGILDSAGVQVVSYVYDSWGQIMSVDGTLASSVGQRNPFRYRGYYFDESSGFYYLGSRYYDPEVGRFINADTLDTTVENNDDLLSGNLFAYCTNNPVNYSDSDGTWKLPNWAKIAIGVAAIAIGVAATVATGGAAAPALIAALQVAGGSAAIGALLGGITGGWKGGRL